MIMEEEWTEFRRDLVDAVKAACRSLVRTPWQTTQETGAFGVPWVLHVFKILNLRLKRSIVAIVFAGKCVIFAFPPISFFFTPQIGRRDGRNQNAFRQLRFFDESTEGATKAYIY